MKEVIKIVLTGGPCAGKTTILNLLQKMYGDAIIFIPEVATKLFSEGYPRPSNPPTAAWQRQFQQSVLETQLKVESEATKQARETNRSVIICDRGILDGAAYTPGGKATFCRRHHLNQKEILTSYTTILHLESRAVGEPAEYGNTSNKHRLESTEVATELDRAVWEAWAGHPQHLRILCEGGFDNKYRLVEEAIRRNL